jgi:diacylglycerol O-acyltransferase / wax synthase
MHIGLAGLLDPGPLVDERGRLRLEDLRAALQVRLTRAPELRRRIRWTRFGQGRPAVVDDDAFAIARHVTAVRLARLDEQAFRTWCANQALAPLDRGHPLWRIVFATGLASGQVGVLIVVHHALADGIAGAALAARLLDPTPGSPGTTVSASPWQPAPPPGPLALTVDAVATRVAAVAAAIGHPAGAPAGFHAARRDVAAGRAALAQRAPATSLQQPIRPGRRLAVIRRPLQQVRQAGHANGATVNDVLLAAVAAGLHQLLAARGDPVDGLALRVSVPVGAPGAARNAGGSTPMVLALPVGEQDPAELLARMVAITRAAKTGRDRSYRGLLASPLLPTSLLRLAIRWLARRGGSRVNLYVSDVSGPPGPLWLADARLLAAVPVAPLVAGVPVAVAALSYAGELAISVQVDGGVADLDVLAAGIAAGLDGLTTSDPTKPDATPASSLPASSRR